MASQKPTNKALTLLALDTSGPKLQFALLHKGNIHTFCEDIAKGHAEILFCRLLDFLTTNHVSYTDIDKIAVTSGPGSFTGLRVGIAAARGLGLALNIPVLGIPNLLALSLNHAEQPFSIVVDARRNQFYVQEFIGAANPVSFPQLMSAEELSDLDKSAILADSTVDMGKLMKFASSLDVAAFPPNPTYVRPADAKPQTKLRVARLQESEQPQ